MCKKLLHSDDVVMGANCIEIDVLAGIELYEEFQILVTQSYLD